MMLSAVVVIALVASASALKPHQSFSRPHPFAAEDDNPAEWLLPTGVRPTKYDLKLTTHIENFKEEDISSFTFDGTVKISITVDPNDVEAIVLHASDNMTFSSIKLTDKDGIEAVLTSDYNTTTNKLTLKREDTTAIVKGDYDLTIVYTGYHGDDMHGFYRSYYTNEANETKWLVTTQFEAYDARRAFPCFDEPQFKALYTITILVNTEKIIKTGYVVLSNMPGDGEPTTEGEFSVFKFQQSAKKISSYLVAFVISDFKATEPTNFEDNKKPFITWGQNRYISVGDGEISQLAGPAALDILRRLTQVPYGYPKLDQIGIPDFSAGAMENWGLVTYRERLIFFNESKNPTSQKQSVVTVTTHELGHQWFGDLVTLHWWSDIWLNEGFATFFEYHASDLIQVDKLNTSTWKIVSQMVTDEVQAGAFATDAQPNSRPLTKEVYRPGDIDANFDNIAYSKGGSVIRMWMHALGSENFYAALKSYLEANSEKNGTPELLLQAFEDNNKNADLKPTSDFNEWHTQAGYPVINVTTVDDQYVLTQERYLVSGEADSVKWTIPITYATSDKSDYENTAPQIIFKKSLENVTIPVENSTYIILNKQQVGYYRVNYDEEGWSKMVELLKLYSGDVHEINRAQLIDDSLWLARATKNYLSYNTALDLTMYLENENELIPWKSALNGFTYLYGKLAGNPDIEPKLKAHISKLVAKRFNDLTLAVKEEDPHTTKLLRSLIASWACKLGVETCVSSAGTLFSSMMESVEAADRPHPDVFSTVVCTNVRSGNQDTWDYVWSLYQATTDNSEQTQYLSALGCASDETVVNKFLNKLLEANNGIRKQDLASAFSSIYSGNPSNVAVAFKFLQEKYVEIANSFGGLDPLGGLLTGIASKLGSAADVKAMTKLSEDIAASDNKNVIAARVSAASAVDIVTSNKEWLDLKQDSVKAWVDEHYPNGGAAVAVTFATLVACLSVSLLFSQ